MPRAPAACASSAHALRRHRAAALAPSSRERERLQRVAGEQRRRLAERDVAGGLAAAQDVVVHARQVVVHERIGVDHLDRRGGRVDARGIGAGEFARGVREQRAHALAAAEHRVAHRLDQRRRRGRVERQRAVEHVLDAPLPLAATRLRRRGQGASSPPSGANAFSTPFSRTSICCCASFSAAWQNATSSAPRLYAASDSCERQLAAFHRATMRFELGERGFEVLAGLAGLWP